MSPTTAPSAATDEVVARIDAVADALAALADLPVCALTDAKLDARVASAARLAASAQEMLARTVAEADQAGVADRAGCSSTRAWLISEHGMSARDAARAVAHGQAMTPQTEPARLAWARGQICGDRAQVIAHAVNGLPDGADLRRAAAAQADLVARATTMTVRELKREAGRLIDVVVDPEDAERLRADRLAGQALTAYEQATFRGRKGLDGVARFSGTMPNLAFDMLTANLDAIASPRRDHLRDSNDEVSDSGERVPAEVRLGRALCEWVEKTDARRVGVGDGVNATIVVTIDEKDLRDRVGAATLSSGDEVPVGELRRLACGAEVLPMVLGGGSAPLDLGRALRLFTRAHRIALAVRDGGCVFPGCERLPGWAEAHHVTAWSLGGRTDVSNGALLCGHHHRLIHRHDADDGDGWQVRIASDGIPEVIPPERVDPRRRPIRHSRFRQRERLRPRPAAA